MMKIFKVRAEDETGKVIDDFYIHANDFNAAVRQAGIGLLEKCRITRIEESGELRSSTRPRDLLTPKGE